MAAGGQNCGRSRQPAGKTAYSRGMSSPSEHVRSGVVEGLLQVGAALGLDRAALLEVAALDEAALLDRDAALPIAAQIAVGHAIAEARPNANLGLEMLRRLQPAALGALGYALAHCETLKDSLSVFIRYQGFVTNALRWERPDPLTLTVEASAQLAAFGHPVEAAVGLWVALGRRLTDKAWSPRSLSFRHARIGASGEHLAFFGVAPDFNAARNALILDVATLALPVRGAEVALRSPLLRLVESCLRAPVEDEFIALVREELRRRLPRGIADKPAVARALGMSTRTLTRRLQQAGTRYDQVLDDTRRAIALGLLGDASLAIYEAAFLLGYSEPSTFHRAFRRWTGETPDAWRRSRSVSVDRKARPVR